MSNAKKIELEEMEEEQQSKRRRINWTDPEDLRAVVIASLGFSNHCVKEYCHLSDGQIYYRLKLANSVGARKAFRDGTSPLAKAVIRNNAAMAEARVEKMIHKPHQTNGKLDDSVK